MVWIGGFMGLCEVCGWIIDLSVSHMPLPGVSVCLVYANPVYRIWGTSDSPFSHAATNSFPSLQMQLSFLAATPTKPFLPVVWEAWSF